MSNQQIEFIIKPDGTVEEKVTGVSGAACEEITAAIERELGDVTKRDRTGDFYNNNAQDTGESVNSGAM